MRLEVASVKTAVVIALYNGERFIEKQLDSLRTQTKAPDQVIMCDDGSTDRTIEIVKNYIEQHGLEKTWILSKNEKNLGYIKNFYHAISMSDADCPDGLCIKQGAITGDARPIVCLPNNVVVKLTNDENDIDAISGN